MVEWAYHIPQTQTGKKRRNRGRLWLGTYWPSASHLRSLTTCSLLGDKRTRTHPHTHKDISNFPFANGVFPKDSPSSYYFPLSSSSSLYAQLLWLYLPKLIYIGLFPGWSPASCSDGTMSPLTWGISMFTGFPGISLGVLTLYFPFPFTQAYMHRCRCYKKGYSPCIPT